MSAERRREPASLEDQFEQARRFLRSPGARAHLMGVGGAGMAGLAALLREAGYRVDGCDIAAGRLPRDFAGRGIPAVGGHDPSHLSAGHQCLIRSAAVPADHPEVARARTLGIPVVVRGAALAAFLRGRPCLAVAGTHGKTTTAAMLAQVLERLGRRPGHCLGGECPALGGPARSPGEGGDLVAEADESDGSLRLYAPRLAVVTNVDFDHMEHFRDEAEFRGVFEQFVRQADTVVLGADDPGAARLRALRPEATTFGFQPERDVSAGALEIRADSVSFDLRIEGSRAGRARLPVTGRFNAMNALAAFAAAWKTGAEPAGLPEALSAFQPVARRQQRLAAGREVEVISDYAHHPAEIRALLDALRLRAARRLVAVFQPHRYSRTRALGDRFPAAFEPADEVVLLPVYAASEAPLPGGSSGDLLRHFRAAGRPPARAAADFGEALAHLVERLAPGDLAVIIGAGDIDGLGRRLAALLAAGGGSPGRRGNGKGISHGQGVREGA